MSLYTISSPFVTGTKREIWGYIGENVYESPVFYAFSGWYDRGSGRGRATVNSGSTYTCYDYGIVVTDSNHLHREWNGTADGKETPCGITIYYKYSDDSTGSYYFSSSGTARYENIYASEERFKKNVTHKIPGWVDE